MERVSAACPLRCTWPAPNVMSPSLSARTSPAAAILIGDLCLSWADELLMASGLPPAALQRGKPVYDVMRTELMAGQYLDMLEQVRRNAEVEPALQVARYKSAKYTI